MTTPPDLSRLTAAEREVLALLAEGHTTKSVAAALGRSEGSVNERLREARRKTGVGSSRELARLLRGEARPQENRDEQIGVAVPPGPAPVAGSAPPVARPRRKALYVTIPLLTLAAAAALAFYPHAPQAIPVLPVPPVPPAPEAAYGSSLRAAFDAEVADSAWAARAEASLRRRYRSIEGVDADGLRVECRATLCLVDGRLARGVGERVGKAAVETLGGPALRASVPGLHADVTHTNSEGEGASFHGEFAAIWRRGGS